MILAAYFKDFIAAHNWKDTVTLTSLGVIVLVMVLGILASVWFPAKTAREEEVHG